MSEDPSLSSSFYKLTPDKVLEAVEMIGVRCTGRILQLNSLENRVYEVEIECEKTPKNRADQFRVVKFYRPDRWSEIQIKEEHQFLSELAQEGVSVISPLSFPDGNTISTLPNHQILFSVYPKVQGRLLDELKREELQTLARYLARLHLIGSKDSFIARPQLTSDRLGVQSLQYLINAQCIPGTLQSRYEQLSNLVIERAAELIDHLPHLRIHGDFHVGNVLWDNTQCFILDFDDCVSGPAIQDFWLIAPGRDQYSMANQEIFLEAYQELRSFQSVDQQVIEALRSLRMIYFSAWIARRWEDPTFKLTFPDFESEQYWQEQITSLYEQYEFIKL